MRLPNAKSLVRLFAFSFLLIQTSALFAQKSRPVFDSLLVEIRLKDNTKVKGIVTKQLEGPRAVFETVDGRTFIISKDNVDAMEIDLKDLNRIVQEEEKAKRKRNRELRKTADTTRFSRNPENHFAFSFNFNPASSRPSHNLYINNYFPDLTIEENETGKPVLNALLHWFFSDDLSFYGGLGFQSYSQSGRGTQADLYDVTSFDLSIGMKYILQDLNETKNLKSFVSLKTGKLITIYKNGNGSGTNANNGKLQDFDFERTLSEINSPFYLSVSLGADYYFTPGLSVFAEYSISKQWSSVNYKFYRFFNHVYSAEIHDFEKEVEFSEWYGEPKIGISLYF